MISIVIPVLNERTTLPATLAALLEQSGKFEIIVVDGGSTDDTRRLVRTYPQVKLLRASPGRAVQMNTGAKQAQGEWLLFLHADTILPRTALLELNDLERDWTVQAGGFRHQFNGGHWGLKLISWINNQRCRRTRVFYGDQAPFVRRNLFDLLGGFPEVPVLEDVLLMEKLLTVTKPILMSNPAITDSRRFLKHGVWRSFSRVFIILSCHKLGFNVPASKFFATVR